jgi:hypothetical protein
VQPSYFFKSNIAVFLWFCTVKYVCSLPSLTVQLNYLRSLCLSQMPSPHAMFVQYAKQHRPPPSDSVSSTSSSVATHLAPAVPTSPRDEKQKLKETGEGEQDVSPRSGRTATSTTSVLPTTGTSGQHSSSDPFHPYTRNVPATQSSSSQHHFHPVSEHSRASTSSSWLTHPPQQPPNSRTDDTDAEDGGDLGEQ